jgi:hypothetical protein
MAENKPKLAKLRCCSPVPCRRLWAASPYASDWWRDSEEKILDEDVWPMESRRHAEGNNAMAEQGSSTQRSRRDGELPISPDKIPGRPDRVFLCLIRGFTLGACVALGLLELGAAGGHMLMIFFGMAGAIIATTRLRCFLWLAMATVIATLLLLLFEKVM